MKSFIQKHQPKVISAICVPATVYFRGLDWLSQKTKFSENFRGKNSNMLSYLVRESKAGAVAEILQDTETKVVERIDSSINSTSEAVEVFRLHWDEKTISIQENLYALYLDLNNKVLSVKQITSGITSANDADIEVIIAAGKKVSAVNLIIAHNHPSGVAKASGSDIDFTKKLNLACKKMNLNLEDHIILTSTKHYSFRDNLVAF